MIHIRVDDDLNTERRFACGIGPKLPGGDSYYFDGDAGAYHRADCQGCNPGGPHQYGTPISQLSGDPGRLGFDRFVAWAASWGHE